LIVRPLRNLTARWNFFVVLCSIVITLKP
jgi:hypothetical protein